MKKDKNRAILLPEGLKIMLGVLCILLLIVFGVQLYRIFQQETEASQAEAHMEKIKNIIDGLQEGQTAEYMLLSPSSWMIIGWPMEGMNPNACKKNKDSDYCLCLCPSSKISDVQTPTTERLKELCEFEGVCKVFNKEIFVKKRNPGYWTALTLPMNYKGFIDISDLISDKKSISILINETTIKVFEEGR